MGNKQKGHYCHGCGRNRANEKFSGKGHRKHICKECKKVGIDKIEHTSPSEKHSEHYYMKRIKNTLQLFHENGAVLLFEYENGKYIMNTEPNFEIYQYQTRLKPSLLNADEFEESSNVREALLSKQEGCDSMESIHYLDSYNGLDGIETSLSKKQKRYINVVLAIENGFFQV